MANTATFKIATPHRVVYEVAGDGTASPSLLTIAAATLIGNMVPGPLLTFWSGSFATQALMRGGCLYGNPVRINIRNQTQVADVTAEINQATADVDTDAVTVTQPEINMQLKDTGSTVLILEIEFLHTLVR